MNESILDEIPCLVWTYDVLGSLASVNRAWIEFTGLNLLASGRTSSWALILGNHASAQFAAALSRAIETGESFSRELRLSGDRGFGKGRLHTVVVKPMVGFNGAITIWLATALDIDDLARARRAEDALNENQREYQRERATSTLFQQALLPPNLPSVPGLVFDAIYEPGTSEFNVGGDWYDAFRLLDGRVLLSIGDVGGSGVQAAVIMGVVRQIMRGIAQLHPDPAMMLDAADRALAIEYPDMFATVWVGMLDLVGRSLTYASAGHPPPLLMESNRKARELDHRTLPIGLRQGHQGRATRIAIPPTSSILLYTDGLIEATHDILAGIARLHHVATEFAGNPSAHPAAAIRHLVINGAPVQDDIAILVVGIDFDVAEQFLQRTSFDSHNAIAARIARRAFVSSLAPGDFSENDIDNAEVVFGELCGNVARYAPGIVDIVVDRSGVQVVLHVLDRGAGFRHISRLPADPFSETGRGLFIVSLMTAELSVSLRDGGGSHARAVLVGRSPASLSAETLPSIDDQVASAG